jgi:hypothetical protein
VAFGAPALPPTERRSLVAAAQRHPPEVTAFACIGVIETAADNLSALDWVRQRGCATDAPTMGSMIYPQGRLGHRQPSYDVEPAPEAFGVSIRRRHGRGCRPRGWSFGRKPASANGPDLNWVTIGRAPNCRVVCG